MGFEDPFFVSIYEQIDGKRTIDRDFYLEQARNANGPILDLGCGSGRLLIPMLETGNPVVGVDSSSEMLGRLQLDLENGTHETNETDRYSSSHKSNLSPDLINRSFEEIEVSELQKFHKSYSLIICAFNSFLHLMDQESQITFLKKVRALLSPDGRIIVDMVNPASHEMFLAQETERELEHTFYDAATGETVESWLTIRNDLLTQTGSLDRDYNVTIENATSEQRTSAVAYRWTYPSEMRLLLMLAGFTERTVFGDFEYGPLTQDSDVQVWIAS